MDFWMTQTLRERDFWAMATGLLSVLGRPSNYWNLLGNTWMQHHTPVVYMDEILTTITFNTAYYMNIHRNHADLVSAVTVSRLQSVWLPSHSAPIKQNSCHLIHMRSYFKVHHKYNDHWFNIGFWRNSHGRPACIIDAASGKMYWFGIWIN